MGSPQSSTNTSDTPSNDRRSASGSGPATSAEMGGVVDRRLGLDRREIAKSQGDDAIPTGLERRRGAGRRLSDFQRAADEGEMTTEQFLFLMAIDAFKKANGKTFPNWSDILEVIRLLGYRKTMPSELNLRSAEDWKEAADAPSNVRPFGWERRFSKKELVELEELAGDINDDDFDAVTESESDAA